MGPGRAGEGQARRKKAGRNGGEQSVFAHEEYSLKKIRGLVRQRFLEKEAPASTGRRLTQESRL
jgi:hypothetical protein